MDLKNNFNLLLNEKIFLFLNRDSRLRPAVGGTSGNDRKGMLDHFLEVL
ncbi:hypothetical protein ACFL29_01675 [Patescibacteria group bacterium]